MFRGVDRAAGIVVAFVLTATAGHAGTGSPQAHGDDSNPYPVAPGATHAEAAIGVDCPTGAFASLAPDAANERYEDPYLRVGCDATHLVVESNGIPAYPFERTTPNELRAQRYSWRIPLRAEVAQEATALPLLGPIAVAINGLPIYGPNEGPFPDPFGDPVANDILDRCLGHTARRGDYHYHALLVACLTAQHAEDVAAPVIAYAFDGFAIRGRTGCADDECDDVVEYRSGWLQAGDPRTHAWEAFEFVEDDDPLTLDPCNGHADPHGDYHYHATDTFPYILGCYSGFIDPSVGSRPRPSRGAPPGR